MRFKEAGKFILRKLTRELPRHLYYHSVEHIRDVYGAAERIGKAEGLDPKSLKLVLTAAWYHDAGFLRGAKNHEEESCRIARVALPNFGYQDSDIALVCGMIMATKIPQTPKNRLEEILADADLDYLGRDDFFSIGDRLYNELSVFGFINTEREWNELQVRFLTSHHYFTHTALQSRQQKKAAHLEILRDKLAQ